MDNKKQNIGNAMIKRIAMTVIHYFKEGFMIEARYYWDQLKGAANMYAAIFGYDGMSGINIAYDALKDACDYMSVNYSDVYQIVVAR